MFMLEYFDSISGQGVSLFRHAVTDPNQRRVAIGSAPDNNVVLEKPMVGLYAAAFECDNNGWTFQLFPRGGVCRVDGHGIQPGDIYRVSNGTRVDLSDIIFLVRLPDTFAPVDDPQKDALADLTQELIRDLHFKIVPESPFDLLKLPQGERTEAIIRLENRVGELAVEHPSFPGLVVYLSGECVKQVILNDLYAGAVSGGDPWGSEASWRVTSSCVPEWEVELDRCKAYVAAMLGVDTPVNVDLPDEFSKRIARVEAEFDDVWAAVARRIHQGGPEYLAVRYIKKSVKELICGFGPLEDLLQNPTISEIMIVGARKIYVERGGVIERSGRRFPSNAVAQSILETMVTSAPGGRIDRAKPTADVRLPGGHRLNLVIAPVTEVPVATIRKHVAKGFTIDHLIRDKVVTRECAEFLKAAVAHRCNIVVSGGTGSGKTTLLNILSGFINPRERVGTIEDVAELTLAHDHLVRMETQQANVEGKGAITHSMLVRNTARQRLDRVIVGEVRDGAAYDMLQIMNMGADGSLTTVHANSCEGAVPRLVGLVQSAVNLPVAAIHQMIATAVDIFVHVERTPSGHRRITHVAECVGLDPTKREVRLKPLFESRVGGRLNPTGRLPSFIEDLTHAKLLDMEIFFSIEAETAGIPGRIS